MIFSLGSRKKKNGYSTVRLTVKGGGVNRYGQPDRKIHVFLRLPLKVGSAVPLPPPASASNSNSFANCCGLMWLGLTHGVSHQPQCDSSCGHLSMMWSFAVNIGHSPSSISMAYQTSLKLCMWHTCVIIWEDKYTFWLWGFLVTLLFAIPFAMQCDLKDCLWKPCPYFWPNGS